MRKAAQALGCYPLTRVFDCQRTQPPSDRPTTLDGFPGERFPCGNPSLENPSREIRCHSSNPCCGCSERFEPTSRPVNLYNPDESRPVRPFDSHVHCLSFRVSVSVATRLDGVWFGRFRYQVNSSNFRLFHISPFFSTS